MKRICSVDDCNNPHVSRGWCNMHYMRWKRHRDVFGGNIRYKTPHEVLEAKTIPEPNSGCLIWLGTSTSAGYGQIIINGKKVYCHRLSWELTNGPIPRGLHVLHHCDNPPCCNPDHLFLGTDQDNTDDKVAKGRQCKGESRPHAKLSESQVLEIYSDTRLQKFIAKDYGVRIPLISRIKNRKRWKHILPDTCEELVAP